ncbi:hypothetical protein [Rhizobium sp. MHM7A]|uniref:hypothetical protein n=1 Tax=Rhizobium sp. MHM7A TaxID=2583233 RepID=UPI0011063E9E|nr:hypothetical protein [Rhizobium sp. MHM7A]TLX17170.1 hypothetical protein FFR93_07625 [Rhizobium sp. MHM7A]
MNFGHDVVRSFMANFRFKDAASDDVLEPFKNTVIQAVLDFDVDAFMKQHPGCSLWRYDNRFSEVFGTSVSGGVRAFIAEAIYRPNLELLHELFPICVNFEEFGWDGWVGTLGRITDSPYHEGVETTGLKGVEELTALGLLEVASQTDEKSGSFVKFSTMGFRTYNTIFAISPRPGEEPVRAYLLR